MFATKSKVTDETKKVVAAADKATFRNLRHAGFSISKGAKQSITKSAEPSAPGSPPNTRGRGRANIRAAIYVNAQPESVIIGPRASYVGEAGRAHELGEEFKGDEFEERPFMGPALQAAIPRFMSDWRGSIGE